MLILQLKCEKYQRKTTLVGNPEGECHLIDPDVGDNILKCVFIGLG
jgi:hypothetical protein